MLSRPCRAQGRSGVPRRLGLGEGSWYHRPAVPRRALPLVLLPLLAACPSFAYGPEAYELYEDDELICMDAGFEGAPCPYIATINHFDTDTDWRPFVLELGFEATERNLDYVTLVYERPGQAPTSHSCAFGRGLDDTDVDGFICTFVGLAGYEEGSTGQRSPADVTQGVMRIDTLIDARTPGPYAFSVWLTDDNDFESEVLRWQLTLHEPQRNLPLAVPEG